MARRGAGLILVVISLLAVAQLLGAGAGIDALGRMSPPTVFALFLTGLVLGALDLPANRRHALLVQVAAGMVVALGSVSLIANNVPPESLLPAYRHGGMSLATAACFTAVGLALYALILRAPWYQSVYAGHDDERIFVVTLGILMLVLAATAAAAFATTQRHHERNLHAALSQMITDRITTIENLLHSRASRAALIADRPALKDLIRSWNGSAGGRARDRVRAQVRDDGVSYLSSGFAGLSFLDAGGREIARIGHLSAAPAVEVVLYGQPAPASLLWKKGFVLQVRTPVYDGGKVTGSVVSEQRLELLSRLTTDLERIGASAEWVLCAAREHRMACFPQRFEPRALLIERNLNGIPVPMAHALAGRSAVVSADDYRGDRVIASYSPVGATGLGAVLKVRAAEFYAPLRAQLWQWAAWLLAMAFVVALLVTWQVRPIARRLLHSEALARRRADVLEQSERGLRELYACLGEGIIVLTARGGIELANSSAERIFAYPAGELAGKPVEILIPPHLRAAHAAGMSRFLGTGATKVIGKGAAVLSGLRRDGTTFDLELSLSTLGREDGMRLVGIVRDVSERVALERRKEEFVSTVSHELRTPLTSIRGSLGLLLGGIGGALPPQARKLMTIAADNCERLILLVSDILDLEKVGSGGLKLVMAETDVGYLLEQAVAANQGFASTHGVKLRLLTPPAGAYLARVDAGRFHQAITNLISNAVKYSPKDKPVDVALVRHDAFLRIEVRDQGPGIPVEFRPRIFQKFSQADGSDARAKSGTGLGLCISRGLIERMGGSVRYETVLGSGTTFFMEVPAIAALPTATPPVTA